LSSEAKNLIISLLQRDPSQRLSEIRDIKSHPFFAPIDWAQIANKGITPPIPRCPKRIDPAVVAMKLQSDRPTQAPMFDEAFDPIRHINGWSFVIEY
jgi:hypothetical protein